jgi:putative FmdB family regulatory protein
MEEDMPIYEYKCNDCGEKFDALLQWRGDTPKGDSSCPECKSENTSKLMSMPASRDPEYGIQK